MILCLCLRITLNFGGDDITEFLAVLLDKINFPYKSVDLTRMYDWNMMEDLKGRMCTLAEVRETIPNCVPRLLNPLPL